MMRIVRLLTVLVALGCGPALAQTSTYQPWAPPQDDLQTMIDKLRKLVDEAEKARAADPVFLQDLKALVAEYDRTPAAPARVPLLSDDFRDGNFTAAPAWTVASGRFSVDPQFGLRSTVALGASSSGSSNQDAAAILLQTLLGQASGQQSSTTAGTASIINAPVRLTNAFSVEVEFGSLVGGGRVAFGPSVARSIHDGYRVFYVSGAQPSIKLVALKKGEQAVVASHNLSTALEDRKRHTIKWTRQSSGAMVVSLDGAEIIKVTDQVFVEAFTGFTITNPGGDFVVRRVVVDSPA